MGRHRLPRSHDERLQRRHRGSGGTHRRGGGRATFRLARSFRGLARFDAGSNPHRPASVAERRLCRREARLRPDRRCAARPWGRALPLRHNSGTGRCLHLVVLVGQFPGSSPRRDGLRLAHKRNTESVRITGSLRESGLCGSGDRGGLLHARQPLGDRFRPTAPHRGERALTRRSRAGSDTRSRRPGDPLP